MKAKLKNRDTDGLGLTPEKWYDVLDVECHGIQSGTKQNISY